MKNVLLILVSSCFLIGFTAVSSANNNDAVSSSNNITDTLIVSLVDKSLPDTLYQHSDKKWQMGIYSLTVIKSANARFTSTTKSLKFTQPVNMKLNAKVSKTILGNTISMNCNSDINTDVLMDIVPTITKTAITSEVQLSLPVPDAHLICEGVSFPISPLLTQLIKEKKPQWEQKVETSITSKLKQLGL